MCYASFSRRVAALTSIASFVGSGTSSASSSPTSADAPAAGTTPEAPARGRRFGPALLLGLLTAVAFANAAPKVLLYDDQSIISQNRLRQGISAIPALFSQHARAGAEESSRLYRPLAMATLAVDRSLYHGRARGYHVSSIVYHVAATLLLFALLLAIGVPRPAAFVAALVFGVHPLHTDAIDSVFNRSEVLATIGVIGGLLWLWRTVDEQRVRAYVGLGVIYLAALLCRESAVTLPLLGALMLVLLRPRPTWRDELRRLWPLALLVVPLAAYLWMRQLALHEPGGGVMASLAQGIAAPGARGERLALVAVAARDYLKLLVWPSPLRASYEDYAVHALWLAIVVHVVLVALAVWTRKRAPLFTWAIAFYYVALFPSTKLFLDPAAFAERFAYLPSIGPVVALAGGLTYLLARQGRRAVVLAGVALAGALIPLTLLRNLDWNSKVALWEADVKVTRGDWRSLINLSEAYLAQGRNEAVLALCQRGMEVAPKHGGMHSNRGIAFINLGRYHDAEEAFRAAIRLDPKAAHYANLARLCALQRRRHDAEVAYREAIARETDPAQRHSLTGEMLLRCFMDGEQALAEFDEALRLEPRLSPAIDGRMAAERVLRLRRAAAASGVALPPEWLLEQGVAHKSSLPGAGEPSSTPASTQAAPAR
jgi:protein O-mannosyl-transferase